MTFLTDSLLYLAAVIPIVWVGVQAGDLYWRLLLRIKAMEPGRRKLANLGAALAALGVTVAFAQAMAYEAHRLSPDGLGRGFVFFSGYVLAITVSERIKRRRYREALRAAGYRHF